MALSAAQSMIAERYRKMIKMGMPEGAVMQKMTTDEVEQQIIDAVMGGGQEEAKTAEPPKGALSAEDEEIVAKYRKMMKMGMPEGAVMQKMATDEVEQRLVDVVAAGQQEEKKEEAKPAEPSKDVLSADDEEIVAKYRKMMKMGMPEGAVLQKMATDEIEQRLVDVVAAGQQEETKEEAKTAEPPKDTLSAEEEEIVAKYRKMMKMGMPEGAVLQKMATDEIEQRLIDVVAAGQQEESKENAAVPAQGKGDQPDSSDEVVTMSLSPEEEEIATKYRKMLTMGMPEGAVMQKMTTDEVEQHIVDSVIAGASSEPSEEVEKPEEGQEPERSAREGLEHQESVYSFEESIVEEELMDGDDGNQGGGRPPNSNRSMGSEGSVEYEYITDDDEELFDEEEITTESGHDQSGEAGIQGSAEMLTSAAVQNRTNDSEDQEEGITVEESIEEPVVVETVQSSDNSETKGNDAVRHIPDEEDDDMPADEKAARAAAVAQAATTLQSVQDDDAKDKSEPEDEMTRVAMETDAILLGQTASRDEIHDSDDEEEEVEFEDSASDEDDNSSSDDSSVEDDIENQRKRQTPVSLPPPGERRTRRQPNPDKGFHMFVFICYFFLIGGGVVVSLLFVLGAVDTKNKDDTTPSEQEFTYFDPIQTPDNCNIGGLENPHVIDQCNCNGMVTVISDSIRQRYDEHRAFFIPSIYQTYEESINSCSTRNQALLWLSSGNDSTFGPEERRQRFALANFFIGTKGEEWTDLMGWLSPDASCSWWGLTCAATQAVESLLLERNNVGGTIPRELVLLESLKSVALTQNSLQGNIPQELFFIPSLQELYLNDNQFGGSIPLALLGAVQLQTLDLELNQLTGSIPKDIAQVTALQSFILGSNELIGDIPSGLFDLPQLTDLQLHNNNLTGSIPSEIANAQSLNTLTLGPNKFQGTFPQEITELTTLERLSFRGIAATGRLPATLAEMQELQVLVISETEITGFIPFVLGSTMDKLSILDLSGNRLTDVIPSSLGQLARLDLLNLSGNMISGFIPSELGNLDSITQLRLNDNRLSGEVPDELGQLDTLEEIFLDGNALEGEVPSQVCSLRLGELTQLVVDCDDGITGVACSIPSCCTNCRA